MSSYKNKVENLHYDAASRSFRAMIVMYEGGDVTKYPTALRLPIDSEFSFVSQKLVEQAKKHRARNGNHLVSRSVTAQPKLSHLGQLARQLTDGLTLPSHRHAA